MIDTDQLSLFTGGVPNRKRADALAKLLEEMLGIAKSSNPFDKAETEVLGQLQELLEQVNSLMHVTPAEALTQAMG